MLLILFELENVLCYFKVLIQGLDSGGIDDETYSAYDKLWRAQDNIQQHIYRPSEIFGF